MILAAITFPNLGISVDPSRVAFSIFGKDVYWYGILIALGFLLATLYCCKRAPHFGLVEDNVLDMLLYVAPVAIIGARVYYCVFYWDLFRDNPISCLYIWEGGLAIYGGVIAGALALLVYSKVKKVKASVLLDLGGLGLLIGQMIGRWGNFVNREAYGAPTDSFLKMGLETANGVDYYHPTFFYESMWNLAGFLILHWYSKRRKYDGQIFTLYVAWYGLGRGFIEGLRMDSLYLFDTGLRVSQILGFASCLVAVGLLIWNLYLSPKRNCHVLLVDAVRQNSGEAAQEDFDAEAEESATTRENCETVDTDCMQTGEQGTSNMDSASLFTMENDSVEADFGETETAGEDLSKAGASTLETVGKDPTKVVSPTLKTAETDPSKGNSGAPGSLEPNTSGRPTEVLTDTDDA